MDSSDVEFLKIFRTKDGSMNAEPNLEEIFWAKIKDIGEVKKANRKSREDRW